jgi:hypothetical protein
MSQYTLGGIGRSSYDGSEKGDMSQSMLGGMGGHLRMGGHARRDGWLS